MTLQAHKVMLNRAGIEQKAVVLKNFQDKVEESLCLARRMGTAYGASNFVCLAGLLHAAKNLRPKDRISIFAYGSGCQGEFYEGTIGSGAPDNVKALAIDRHLDERERLSVDQYRKVESTRQDLIDCPTFEPETGELNEAYTRLYEGQKLLVLKKVRDYERHYDWS
jgi:3-hydroxy-3-methylglutaryl CoA synthase